MPKRKILKEKEIEVTTVNKLWIVYSTNRDHCFLDEISRGLFPQTYTCGCNACFQELPRPAQPVTKSTDWVAVRQEDRPI